MPRIAYTAKNLSLKRRQLIATADVITRQYADAGFDLTLRQLYYRFVARNLIDNTQRS